jgi:GxxExxY protein
MSGEVELPDAFDEPDPELNRITGAVIGEAIEVHRHLGGGHLEAAYEEAMAIEMDLRCIRYARQVDIELTYKGRPIGHGRLDFLIEDRVIVDLKAVKALSDAHATQMISYLAITGHPLALLINFDVGALRNGIRRIAGRGRAAR